MAIICQKGERLTHFQLWDFKRKRHWLFCSHRTLFFFFYSTFSVPNLPVKRSGCHPEWQPVCMSNCPLCAVVTHTNTLTHSLHTVHADPPTLTVSHVHHTTHAGPPTQPPTVPTHTLCRTWWTGWRVQSVPLDDPHFILQLFVHWITKCVYIHLNNAVITSVLWHR